jgi:hypothetical protein
LFLRKGEFRVREIPKLFINTGLLDLLKILVSKWAYKRLLEVLAPKLFGRKGTFKIRVKDIILNNYVRCVCHESILIFIHTTHSLSQICRGDIEREWRHTDIPTRHPYFTKMIKL